MSWSCPACGARSPDTFKVCRKRGCHGMLFRDLRKFLAVLQVRGLIS